MKFGSLFSGIGGLDLGLERAGMECTWQVEIDDYCTKVLTKHWPKVSKYRDIRECGRHNLEAVDLICGGFPCQPVSLAGKRQAQADSRWLWPEFARIIRELQPRYVLVENVPGLYTAGGSEVLADLAESGYDAEWDDIPAAAFGAPHLRYRVFIVAYPISAISRREQGILGEPTRQVWWPSAKGSTSLQSKRRQTHNSNSEPSGQTVADADDRGSQGYGRLCIFGKSAGEQFIGSSSRPNESWWQFEPDVGRVAHGVPARVDRLRGLGNAVVPQVAEWVGRRIIEASGLAR